MIIPQTHIFNFFPGSIHSERILKTLSLFASRQKNTYLPNQQVWLNKLYFQISNSKKKCLTVDTRDVNNLGPGKFRTFAENNSDSRYSSYLAKRVSWENLVFSIFKLNFDQNFGYKNLEVNSQNLLFNGNINEKSQSANRENFRDGRSSGSETSENYRGNDRSLQCESAATRRLESSGSRGESIAREHSNRGNCSEQFGGSARKKPRFLSD